MCDRHLRRRRKRSGDLPSGRGDLWDGEFESLVSVGN